MEPMTDQLARSGVNAEVRESMPTVESYLDVDTRPVPGHLYDRSTEDLGNGTFDPVMFTSADFHHAEVERVWKRTWQLACREREVSSPGDYVTYDIAGQSVVIVRGADGVLRAFHNVCQHRGTPLTTGRGSAAELECSFHGWTWGLSGELTRVPCRWDFPEVDDAAYGLPPVRLGVWNGFVFVNLAADGPSLEEYLGPAVTGQWEHWPRAHYWKAAHVGKIVPSNWKAVLGAFIESYHVMRVHPQSLKYAGDCNAAYDLYGLHSRFLAPLAVPSPHLGDTVDEQEVAETMIRDAVADMFGGAVDIPEVPEGTPARPVVADWVRRTFGNQSGVDFSARSDAEVLDTIDYHIFPNFVIFGGYSFPLYYRIRPDGDDPGSCLFEVAVLLEFAPGVEPPPDMPLRMTPTDEPWSAATELGGLGPILDQDMFNCVKLQRGLRSDGYRRMTLSNYQERNIRSFLSHILRLVDA